MQRSSAQGVPFEAPPSELHERMPGWAWIWLFQELHRSGSFRACGRRLNMTPNAIRRQVGFLEAALGYMVLTRHVDGVRATPEGLGVLQVAERMEAQVIALLRAGGGDKNEEGSVRVAVTEGIGAAWIAPRLAIFRQAHPRLRLELACAMDSADVLRLEADIAVQLTRPQHLDVKVVRLGYLHVMPYTSASYVAARGMPRTIEELAGHDLVVQMSEQSEATEHLRGLFADHRFAGAVAMTTNVSSANALAIANGGGIGFLPTYLSALRIGLLPVECGAHARFDIWMTYHRDVEQIPRVRRVIEWIRSSFDARRYPAFGEQRADPSTLPAMMRVDPLVEALEKKPIRD